MLAADGSPIDKFNYGVELTGIGTAEFDGRPLLLVSSANELTAWAVEPAESGPTVSTETVPNNNGDIKRRSHRQSVGRTGPLVTLGC